MEEDINKYEASRLITLSSEKKNEGPQKGTSKKTQFLNNVRGDSDVATLWQTMLDIEK
jgi:hypothetical protein